jgi:hypothetical protein
VTAVARPPVVVDWQLAAVGIDTQVPAQFIV